MKKISHLSELLSENINSLYNAEQQQLESLQKVGKKIENPELKLALDNYRDQKNQQIERVKKSLSILHAKPVAKENEVVGQILEETAKAERHCEDCHLAEASIIGSLQQLNHYHIANYGTAAAYAKALGKNDVADLLHRNLEEEKATDRKLSRLAEDKINRQSIGIITA